MRLRKKFFYSILALFFLFIILYFHLLVYGIQQGIGQMNLIWNAQSFKEFLEKGEYSDSVKKVHREKLALIREIKQFAIDSLGLKASKSYTSIYDQKGKPILWAVTACQPYQLEAKEWHYGPLGKMPYKGFFDSTKTKNLVTSLKNEGYDVNVYEPAAWSTLGWFRDPILSSMLDWSEGDLASLIIHEMTHSTIWISGNVEYNENLADFVGDNGALLFLERKYGKHSDVYQKYIHKEEDTQKFYSHILKGAQRLDSLYRRFTPEDSKKEKEAKKQKLIREIMQSMQQVSFFNKDKYQNLFQKGTPNNAYFMAFLRYRSKQNDFEQEFKQRFHANFQKYLAYLKKKYN